MNKKKILIVIQLMRRGGVELVALNFARALDPEKYDITFYLQNPYENQDEELAEEVRNNGFRILERPKEITGYKKNYNYLVELFKKEQFDVVHSHVMFFSALVMLAAKKCNIGVRVAHSHATKWNRKENFVFKIYKCAMRFILNRFATDKLACSDAAGAYLYGEREFNKNGRFIANGIETKKYAFNKNMREKKRQEFSLAEIEILVGHIGSLYYIKNQTFLVDVFSKMLLKNPHIKLILVGEDFEDGKVLKKVQSMGLADKVIFAGQRNDINELLNAMDIMIFPSLFEALPLSLIEAQASKLPCLISDSVTNQVKFNDNVDFMSLEKSADEWADWAFELLALNREDVSITALKDNYDISSSIKILDEIYNK